MLCAHARAYACMCVCVCVPSQHFVLWADFKVSRFQVCVCVCVCVLCVCVCVSVCVCVCMSVSHQSVHEKRHDTRREQCLFISNLVVGQ